MRRSRTLPVDWDFHRKLSNAKLEYESTMFKKITWPEFTSKISVLPDNINDIEFQRKKRRPNGKEIVF